MVVGKIRELLRGRESEPERVEDRRLDRFFNLLFWTYLAGAYLWHAYRAETALGEPRTILAFLVLGLVWLFLPWDPPADRRRLLAVPAFLAAALAVAFLDGGGISFGFLGIVVANAVFLFGFRWAVAYLVGIVGLLSVTALLLIPEMSALDALLQSLLVLPSLAFVIGICMIAVLAERRKERSEELLSELEAAHSELRRYADRVRDLTISEERNRMAREIHDTLGHYLTVVNVQLEAAGKLIDHEPDRARQEVLKAKELSSQALQEVRRSVRALEPAAMEEQQGTEALERLVREFEASGMRVSFEVRGEERELPPEAALALYRTLQEALTNVLRHSGADRIRATLAFGNPSVRLTVADDGRGAPEGADTRGFGLRGLRERAAALDGSLRTENVSDGGFVLELELPLEPAGG
jgi:signal transduction histidine kinase